MKFAPTVAEHEQLEARVAVLEKAFADFVRQAREAVKDDSPVPGSLAERVCAELHELSSHMSDDDHPTYTAGVCAAVIDATTIVRRALAGVGDGRETVRKAVELLNRVIMEFGGTVGTKCQVKDLIEVRAMLTNLLGG